MGLHTGRQDQVSMGAAMSEEEARAQYYQAHKDDDDEWGEPERQPASSKRRLASMISVRFSPDEAKMVRRAAESADESISQFVRKAALQRCQHPRYLAPSISGTALQSSQSQSTSPGSTSTMGGSEASPGGYWTVGTVLISPTSHKTKLPL